MLLLKTKEIIYVGFALTESSAIEDEIVAFFYFTCSRLFLNWFCFAIIFLSFSFQVSFSRLGSSLLTVIIVTETAVLLVTNRQLIEH